MDTQKKREAQEFGRIAEVMASQAYIKKGYTVIERNWRQGKTEIDLVCQKEDLIVVAEVKARKDSEEDALEAVTKDKRRRMVKAADTMIRKLKGCNRYRFDIVTCTGDKENFKLEIIEDAFVAADMF